MTLRFYVRVAKGSAVTPATKSPQVSWQGPSRLLRRLFETQQKFRFEGFVRLACTWQVVAVRRVNELFTDT